MSHLTPNGNYADFWRAASWPMGLPRPAAKTAVMVLERIHEALTLPGSQRGVGIRSIEVITTAVEFRAILEPTGKPATPPRIASAKEPPAWFACSGEETNDTEGQPRIDPLAQPEHDHAYEYGYDRRVSQSRFAVGLRDWLLPFVGSAFLSVPFPGATTAANPCRQAHVGFIAAYRWSEGPQGESCRCS